MTALENGMEIAREYGKRSFYEDYEIHQKEWKNYGKHRIYITLDGISNGKVQKTYKIGWVDVKENKFVKTV